MARPLARALQGLGSIRDEIGRTLRLDSWINAVTGLGGTRDRTTQGEISAVIPLRPVQLEHLYHGNDLAAKIVDKIVREAVRRGFTIEGDDDGEILGAAKDRKAIQAVTEAAIWGRLYGGGAVLIGTDGPMDEPLDVETMRPGSLRYLMALDRLSLSVADWYSNPTEDKFGEPRIYTITREGGGGTTATAGSLVHESRLVMFGGAMTSERMRTRNEGWDLSVLQRPHDVLRDVGQSWRSIMNLIQDMSQAVFAVDGLVEMIAEGEKETVLQRMEVVDMGRSVARAVVIDKDGEDFKHVGAVNVTGVEPLMLMIFQRLSGAADMPMTILFGMSPGGMNATGESDTRGWYDTVQAYRTDELEPALALVLEIVARDAGLSHEITIQWPPLWQPTSKEQAELDKMDAETDKIRIDSGVLLPEEVTLVKFRDGEYADVIDFSAREEALAEPPPEPPPMLPPGAVPPEGGAVPPEGGAVPPEGGAVPPEGGAVPPEDEDEDEDEDE